MAHVFGPVPSRRLGFSLGVDVIPLKVCTLNCIYCQLGRTTRQTLQRREYVPADVVMSELQQVLLEGQQIDYVTFSGSGEPTLNSKIGQMIREIKTMTSIPVAVLTNASLIDDLDVRGDLLAADLVKPSLDAASPGVFRRVNRPHGGLDIECIIDGLVKFRREYSGQIWLEIMLVKRINDSEEELNRLKDAVEQIKPERIQLNTVVRPPADVKAKPLSVQELEQIRGRFGSSCEVIAAFRRREQAAYKSDLEQAVLRLVRRRPVTLEDICNSLGHHRDEVLKYLQVLEEESQITSELFDAKRYFLPARMPEKEFH